MDRAEFKSLWTVELHNSEYACDEQEDSILKESYQKAHAQQLKDLISLGAPVNDCVHFTDVDNDIAKIERIHYSFEDRKVLIYLSFNPKYKTE